LEHLGNTNIEIGTLGKQSQKSEHLGDTQIEVGTLGTLGKHKHRCR